MDVPRLLLIEDDQLFLKVIKKHLKYTSKEINYIIIKPLELKQELEKREKIIQSKLQMKIIRILHELGIPSHMKGYLYLKEGINLVYRGKEELSLIRKIYPFIAEKYNSSISNVERSIRHAIETSWNRGNWDLMEELFGNSIDQEKAKPTNLEFILTIAEKLKLDSFKE